MTHRSRKDSSRVHFLQMSERQQRIDGANGIESK